MNRLVLALAIWFALTAPAWAGFEEGLAAYERGDYATAVREWLPLAQQGDAAAQFNLGVMYDTGKGVPQDYAEAVRWYRRAAEQGHAAAMNYLGFMYEYGRGVPTDLVQAYAWYSLAAARMTDESDRDAAVRYRDDVARRLSPEKLTHAQALARQIDRVLASGRGPTDNGTTAPGAGLKLDATFVRRRIGGEDVIVVQGHVSNTTDVIQPVPTLRAVLRNDKNQWLTDWTFSIEQSELRPGESATFTTMARNPPEASKRLSITFTDGPADNGTAAPSENPFADPIAGLVVEVQQSLAALGYDPGPADGRLGPKTRAAIRAFQADDGLPVDGEVSNRLTLRLRAALRLARVEPQQVEKRRELIGSGTGFIVTRDAHVLTNHHVVAECGEVRGRRVGEAAESAKVVALDADNDLALLRLATRAAALAPLGGPAGEDVG
ncbi:MAG: peptidoglycan-binding protein, partial [Dongiaceae bacterium]